jgi:hypothetical protein
LANNDLDEDRGMVDENNNEEDWGANQNQGWNQQPEAPANDWGNDSQVDANNNEWGNEASEYVVAPVQQDNDWGNANQGQAQVANAATLISNNPLVDAIFVVLTILIVGIVVGKAGF